MSKKIVMTIMLGMNRFAEKDTQHPFDMSHAETFNKIWLPQISEIEKTCSTPIYEMTKTLDEFITQYNTENPDIDQITKDDIFVIIGRGTIGSSSEEHLSEALLEARRSYGHSAFFVFYTKSFGTVDTLRALDILNNQNYRFSAHLLFCIDGYATPISKASVSKIYRYKNKKERRFIIPRNVKRAYGIVQRREGFKGLQVGAFHDSRCRNFVIRSKDTKGFEYTKYIDGYKRKLDVCHFNMEEIVSTIKCCKYNNNSYTINELLKMHCKKYMLGKI